MDGISIQYIKSNNINLKMNMMYINVKVEIRDAATNHVGISRNYSNGNIHHT